jgi:hypothetical protein
VNETDYETALGMHFRSRIKVKPWKYQNPSSALAGENTFAGVTALINDLEWSIIRLFRIFETWGPINGEMVVHIPFHASLTNALEQSNEGFRQQSPKLSQ